LRGDEVGVAQQDAATPFGVAARELARELGVRRVADLSVLAPELACHAGTDIEAVEVASTQTAKAPNELPVGGGLQAKGGLAGEERGVEVGRGDEPVRPLRPRIDDENTLRKVLGEPLVGGFVQLDGVESQCARFCAGRAERRPKDTLGVAERDHLVAACESKGLFAVPPAGHEAAVGPARPSSSGIAAAEVASLPRCTVIALERPTAAFGGGSESRTDRRPLRVARVAQIEE
jgi:hypothetical protein